MFTDAKPKKVSKKMLKKMSNVIAALSDPVSVERLSEFRRYAKARKIQEYSKETLLPQTIAAEKLIAKGHKAYKSIVNQEVRLSQSEDPKISATSKRHSDYLGKGSSEPPLFFAQWEEVVPSLLANIQKYQQLYAEYKGCKEKDAQEGFLKGWTTSDEEFQMQNKALDEMLRVEGTINRAIIAYNGCMKLREELLKCDGSSPGGIESSFMGKLLGNLIQVSSVENEKQEAANQKKQLLEEKNKELQCSIRKTQKVIEEASKLAMEQVKEVTFHVAAGLEGANPEDGISTLLGILQEKIDTSIIQIEQFDTNKSQNNLKEISRVFNKVFNIGSQESKTVVENSHYEYLRFLYQLNQEYYLSVKEKLRSLKLSETNKFTIVLSDLKKIERERLEKAKEFLKKYQVKDVRFLAKLLVPVPRAVFRLKKEHLDPIIKSAVTDKQKRLSAQVDAAQAKLAQMTSSGELPLDKCYEKLSKDIPRYKERLSEMLKEQQEPVQCMETILVLEQEIKIGILDSVESINARFIIQQKMHVQQQQDREAEQKSSAELFTFENFRPEKLRLLEDRIVLDVLSRLFSPAANVTYSEVRNMLLSLRGESTSSEPVQNHSFFQFPSLWIGHETSEQVLISIPHKAGMPLQTDIQDPNVIAQLRSACINTGMEYERLQGIVDNQRHLVQGGIAPSY